MKRKTVFVDRRITDEAEAALRVRGFEVVTLPPFARLSEAVASHTDMLLFRIEGEVFAHADYVGTAPFVFDALYDAGVKKIHLIDDDIAPEHPRDARLNILTLGKRAFCKRECASQYVTERLLRLGYEIVYVKQGYPACTTLKLTESAVITADRGMARVMRECGIDVTEIKEGGIDLYPYEYGFIGGSAGVFGKEVYFTGTLADHPSKKEILRAIESAGLTPVYLTRTRPIDVGGLFFTD